MVVLDSPAAAVAEDDFCNPADVAGEADLCNLVKALVALCNLVEVRDYRTKDREDHLDLGQSHCWDQDQDHPGSP